MYRRATRSTSERHCERTGVPGGQAGLPALPIYKEWVPGLSSGRRSASERGSTGGPLGPEEEALFQRLRDLRKELADRQRVPAYIVFSDKVLLEMVSRRPATEQDLLDVPGVGPAKLQKYGPAFLEALGE